VTVHLGGKWGWPLSSFPFQIWVFACGYWNLFAFYVWCGMFTSLGPSTFQIREIKIRPADPALFKETTHRVWAPSARTFIFYDTTHTLFSEIGLHKVLSRVWVTIDGVWFVEWIYRPRSSNKTSSDLIGNRTRHLCNMNPVCDKRTYVPHEDDYYTGIRTTYTKELKILNNPAVCRIWGFHGGDYEECRLLGCGAV
jgi:hypothetical protein